MSIEFEFIDEEPQIIKQKYGFLPKSVWLLDYDRKYENLEISDLGIKRTVAIGRINYTNSRFNPAVAERVIKYWSNKGDLVLDPFMGYGMRGFVAVNLGRSYIGFEISPKTYNQVKKILEDNRLVNFDKMKILLSNGCYLKEIENDSIDLIFTCPPYWKVERYEKVPGQLSECKSYNIFLEMINICVKNCYRVLKENKYMVWVVADFRLDEKFYCFHKDFIEIAEKNKFSLHDIIINVLRSPFISANPLQCDRFKITHKMHEYIIVFKK